MAKKENKTFTISKIEVEKNTAEPVIVELNEMEYAEELKKQNTASSTENPDAFDEKHVRQVVMTKVFGVNDNLNISKRQKFFKNLVSITFIVLVVLILAYTFYNDFFDSTKTHKPWAEIKVILFSNWFYLVCAFFALFFVYFFKGLKLSILCKTTSNRFHFVTCFETGIIGAYYNNVTPLAVGGQPFEIYHLSKHGVHGGTASSLPIVAFFLHQLAFVILTIVSLSLFKQNTFTDFTSVLPIIVISMSIIGLVLCMFVPSMVIVFSLMPRLCSRLVKFIINLGGKFRLVRNPKKTIFSIMKTITHNARCVKKISTSPFGFLLSFLFSFGEQIANCSIAYFTLKFFGFDLPESGFVEWLMILQVCFILYSAISFIPTPGNSGAADISFYTLFSAGLLGGLAFPALMVWRMLSFYSIIIIGFIFIKFKKHLEKKEELRKQPKSLI